jgi:hypothetical protein
MRGGRRGGSSSSSDTGRRCRERMGSLRSEASVSRRMGSLRSEASVSSRSLTPHVVHRPVPEEVMVSPPAYQ